MEAARSAVESVVAPNPGSERPGTGVGRGDWIWSIALRGFGGLVLIMAGVVVIELMRISRPVWHDVGLWRFIRGSDWDPVAGSFGAWPFVYGTLLTSALSLLMAFPLGLGLALFVTELAPTRFRRLIAFPIEILAAVPSVVYGLWGLFILVPWLRHAVEPLLGRWLGWLPLFQGPPLGIGYLAAAMILAVMILPTISSVSIEVLSTVPGLLREGALALGATPWETVRIVVLPSCRVGLLGGALLSLGRALGETMAVTMVIGNSPDVSVSLFAPGYSLPAVIANEFAEATSGLHTAALAGLGLILFGLSLVLSGSARLLMQAVNGRMSAAKVSP